MRQTTATTHKPNLNKSTTKLLAGGIAGLAVLGIGQGAAFASQGHGSAHQPDAAYTSDRPMSGMPTATKRTVSVPSSSQYSASVALQAMPAGTVTFRHDGTTLEATISAFGLTPGSTHLAQVVFGGNREPITFSQFTASATGQVDTTITSLRPVRRLPERATFQIELSTSPGQPIALTALPHGKGRLESAPMPLQAVEAAGEGNLAGHASVNYDGQTQTLTVRVDASGFAPNTNHAAHVHMGTCTAQGAVIYMLQDLHADGRGQIDQTDVIHNLASFTTPAGGWYLNIHEGSSATILDGAGNPTPFFRPLLCSNLPPSSTTSSSAGNQSQQSSSGTGMSSSSGNGGGQPGSQASSTGSTTTTMPSSGGTTTPASGGSGMPSRPQQEVLSAALQPVGMSDASGSAQVTLEPSSGQACATVDVSGLVSIAPAEIDGPNGPAVRFGLHTVTPGQSSAGCSDVGAATLSGMEADPGNYQFKVSVPGQTAPALVGTLQAQAMSS